MSGRRGAMRRLTDTLRQQILALRQEGHDTDRIAKRCRCGESTVYNVLADWRDKGVPIADRRRGAKAVPKPPAPPRPKAPPRPTNVTAVKPPVRYSAARLRTAARLATEINAHWARRGVSANARVEHGDVVSDVALLMASQPGGRR